MSLAAAQREPTRDASPLAVVYREAMRAGEGDLWRGLRYRLASLLITSGRPPREWRRICDDLEPTVATLLERCAGWPRLRAIRTAPMILAAAEIEAATVWDEVHG